MLMQMILSSHQAPVMAVYWPLHASSSPFHSRVPSQDGDHLSTSVDHSQTQGKFQFPPSPSLMTSLEDKRVPPNKKRPESLSLSLSLRPPLSSGNGVTPLPSPALRSGRQSSFYHHLSSRTTTPRDSPAVVTSELPTPTPAVSNKLLPALPEAHALFLTLTLMHCLEPGEELSYSPYQIQTTGDSSGGSSPSGRCGLGFMEDSQDVYSEIDQAEWMGNLGATQTGYTSISGAKTMTSALSKSHEVQWSGYGRSFRPLSLSWISKCIHTCTCIDMCVAGTHAHTRHTQPHISCTPIVHVTALFKGVCVSLCVQMYLRACSSLFRTLACSSPSVMWTLLHWEYSQTLHYCHPHPSIVCIQRRCLSLPSARASSLLGTSGARVMGPLGGSLLALNLALKALQVCVCVPCLLVCLCFYVVWISQHAFALTSGEWVRTLQAVYGPTMIKHMRSIKNALVNLVDSSTLKVVVDGPLNLRDMQQLASSQSELT